MTATTNHQWRLVSRPTGLIKESDFKWFEVPVPTPGEGHVLIRNMYLSLDPANRGWVTDRKSYVPPVGIDEVMRAGGIGTVEKSNHPNFQDGDTVQGMLGWQQYSVVDGRALTKLPKDSQVPLTAYLGLFGYIGLTAYFGLLDVGKPKEGETLVVSAAAGAVGSIVGQIGKIKGCRVVGIAGSDEKCKWIVDELGFDVAINYKAEAVFEKLKQHCSSGIDVYFDNVGGEILNDVLALINLRARIPLCGMISQYNATEPVPGPSNLINLIARRARIEGFLVLDYVNRTQEAMTDLGKWLAQGKIKYRVDVVEGLEKAPQAINKLFDGSNHGKLIVKV